MKKTILVSLAALAGAGCATVQISPQRFEASQASIRGAEEVGANGVPAARLHLQLAKDQTVSARALAAEGDERAELVLARAQADAELALGLAREVSVHNAAVKAAADLKALKAVAAP
jgi:hypothetical protein